MKVKPILFNTEMVKAISKGHKTQTRRVVKWNKKITDAKVGFTAFCNDGEYAVRGVHENGEFGESHFILPFKKGDIMWVRETFYKTKNPELNGFFYYKALIDDGWKLNWKPSIFMPKEACRLFLKVTNVRIEKLNSISENDSIKEGVKYDSDFKTYNCYLCNNKGHKGSEIICEDGFYDNAYESFRSLWYSINGSESWKDNPFVLVYEFEITEKPIDFIKRINK